MQSFQNQTLLASSLQTAYNLRVLPSLIQGLLSDLSHAVEERIQSAFDLSKISKDVLVNGSYTLDYWLPYSNWKMSTFRSKSFQSTVSVSIPLSRKNRTDLYNCPSVCCCTLDSPRVNVWGYDRLLYQGKVSWRKLSSRPTQAWTGLFMDCSSQLELISLLGLHTWKSA